MKKTIAIFILLAITAPCIAMQKNKTRTYWLEIECRRETTYNSEKNPKASAMVEIGNDLFTLYQYHDGSKLYSCSEHRDKNDIKKVLEDSLSWFEDSPQKQKATYYHNLKVEE